MAATFPTTTSGIPRTLQASQATAVARKQRSKEEEEARKQRTMDLIPLILGGIGGIGGSIIGGPAAGLGGFQGGSSLGGIISKIYGLT
jgi:predicted lipid-binding transport protein (Tim44 family)